MMAAICAKEERNEVVLVEKNERIGKKILATGNGKCNLGNKNLKTDCYYCEDKERLSKILHRFGTEESLSFFNQLGLMIREKNGYLYPYCEQASAVLDVFRMELARKNIKTICNTLIRSCTFDKKREQFVLSDDMGNYYQADRVIVSCGSPASLKTGGRDGICIAESFGIPVKMLVPGLVQLRTKETKQKSIAGVRCQARITLLIGGREAGMELGELQFTEYGISGIPVFQLSRMAAYGLMDHKEVKVKIDFLPEYTKEELMQMLGMLVKNRKTESLENLQTGILHKKLNLFLLHQCGLNQQDPAGVLNSQKIHELVHYYKNFEMVITQTNPFQNAQVCAGGIPLSEVTDNFEAIRQRGLYFTGELLDVDGICGGYNLHWAFATGFIAGHAAKGNRTYA